MKILLVRQGEVVTTYNHKERGELLRVIAGILFSVDILEPTYIAGTNLYLHLAKLNEDMKGVKGWKMRFSNPSKRHPIPSGSGLIAYRGQFYVDYFCIDATQRTGKISARIARRRIDVINLERFRRHPPSDPEQQLEMTLGLIELHESRGLKIRSGTGSLGSALLKSMPSWEDKRHGAPRFINKYGRQYLPGNYYGVSPRVSGTIPSGYYLDQSGAHHAIAETTKLPHPHFLRARGYHQAAVVKFDLWKKWTKQGEDIFNEILAGKHTGLLLARLYISTLPPTQRHLYPPWAQKRGERFVWLWTPEIRFILNDERIQLDSFMAGFTSIIGDPTLAEYGIWSQNYLREHQWSKQYTKPSLLSAYGMLAFNPEKYKTLRRYWGGTGINGTPVILPAAGAVHEKSIKFDPEKYQHAMCNVIARGVIEAETRTRSLEYAKELHSQGYHVAQIYSDGIFVETDQLPFIRDGWEIEGEHTNVRIPKSHYFISDQVTKEPGIPNSESDKIWRERRERARVVLFA